MAWEEDRELENREAKWGETEGGEKFQQQPNVIFRKRK